MRELKFWGSILQDNLSQHAYSFLDKCFVRDFRKRPNAARLLTHPFVDNEIQASRNKSLDLPGHGHQNGNGGDRQVARRRSMSSDAADESSSDNHRRDPRLPQHQGMS